MRNRIRVALCAVLAALAAGCTPTPFQRLLALPEGGDARSVRQSQDGGYVIGGYHAGPGDLFLAKASPLGVLEWTETYGGPFGELDGQVRLTADGGYLLCGDLGTSNDVTSFDPFLVRTDSLGSVEWTYTLEGTDDERCSDVLEAADGHVLLATSKAQPPLDPLVAVLLTASGEVEWQRTIHGHRGFVAETPEHGFAFASSDACCGPGSPSDFLLIATDGAGNELWRHSYPTPESDAPTRIEATPSGYFLAGNATVGAGPTSLLSTRVVTTDSAGLSPHIGTTGAIYAAASVPAEAGAFVSTGAYYDPTNGADIALVRSDTAGNTTWQRTFGRANTDEVLDLAATADGGYVLVGRSVGSEPQVPVYLIKTDALGNAGPNPS